MKIFFIIEIFALFYAAIVFIFVSWTWYVEIKNRKKRNPRAEIGKALDAMRGKKVILILFRVISWIFVVDWLVLGTVFAYFVWHIHFAPLDAFISFLEPTLTGKDGNFFFFTLFIGIPLGGKGWLLLSEIADILSDTSLHVTNQGRLDYRKRFF